MASTYRIDAQTGVANVPSTRKYRKECAIRRNQTRSSRELFLSEVRNSLPRANLRTESSFAEGRISIEASMAADQLLRSNGFDSWGRKLEQ